jgi:hypothetical protein
VQVIVNGVASNGVTMSIGTEGRICPSDMLEQIPDEVLDLLNGEVIRNGGVSLTRGRTFTTPTQGRLQEGASGLFAGFQIRGLILDPCPPGGDLPVPSSPCWVTRNESTGTTHIAFDLDGNELERNREDRSISAAAVAELSQTPAVSLDRLTETALAQVHVLATAPKDQSVSRGLDAGAALTFEGPNGPWQVPQVLPGIYGLAFSDVEINGQVQGVVETGQYRASAPGGADIPPFSVDLAVPSPLEWTNKAEAFPEVLRHQGLRVEWNGGMSPFEFVQISGLSITAQGAGSVFECAVPYPRGDFTVPATVLRNMMQTGPAAGSGRLVVSTAAGTVLFSVPGLDFLNSAYYDTTTLLVSYGGEGE